MGRYSPEKTEMPKQVYATPRPFASQQAPHTEVHIWVRCKGAPLQTGRLKDTYRTEGPEDIQKGLVQQVVAFKETAGRHIMQGAPHDAITLEDAH